ncbi:MAG: hypothetical protein RLO80_04310 [Hyphomonas sp.]
MNFAPKRWMGLGLGAAMIGAAGLTACGNEQAPVAAPAVAADTHADHGGEGGDGEGEGGFARIDAMKALPTEKRLAFMSGHVEAGLALYRAGAPDQAAKHLLHPVSETHASERAGLDALGFKPEVFEQVSAGLDAGKPASEVEPLLVEAEANIAAMRAAAGGEPKELIEYLMLTLADEYDAGVDDGVIVNAGEYQDAYGFAVVARDIAAAQDPEVYGALRTELDMLILMWPGKGPLADSTPAPEALMAEALERVKSAIANLA